MKAAEVQRNNLNDQLSATTSVFEAAKVFRRVDPAAALDCFQTIIGVYTSKGEFRRAAPHMESSAEILDVEMGDRKKAMDCYNKAARWYEDDRAQA